MGKMGDGSEFAERLSKIPVEKQFALHCDMSAGALLPKSSLADPTDPNIVGDFLPVVMIEGRLDHADDEHAFGKVVFSITLNDAKVLKRTIERLEQAVDQSTTHERN